MSFRGIIGHGRLLSLLSRAIARGTLPPSLMLAGSRGIGKRRAATAIATTLNCARAGPAGTLEVDACGACPSCRRIARGIHPDVVVLEPGESGAIKIEPVRDVIDRANYRPFEGRRRVVIVDDADALIPQAQNALLKTLEEPPSASVFVLVTSMPDTLLPTVRSRCRPLRFGELSAAEVAAILVRDHQYSESDARAAAAETGGSVGRALEARGVDVGEAREAAQHLLHQIARASDPARRLEAARALVGKASSLNREREQLAVRLRVLASLLRDLGVLAAKAEGCPLANDDLRMDLDRLTDVFDGERTTRAFAAVDRALAVLGRSSNAGPKVVADWLALQL
jgi:DNA polymerase-3 subunit delta'